MKKKTRKPRMKKTPVPVEAQKVAPVEVGQLEPQHIDMLVGAEEPHVIVAIPKSTWEKVKEYLGF